MFDATRKEKTPHPSPLPASGARGKDAPDGVRETLAWVLAFAIEDQYRISNGTSTILTAGWSI